MAEYGFEELFNVLKSQEIPEAIRAKLFEYFPESDQEVQSFILGGTGFPERPVKESTKQSIRGIWTIQTAPFGQSLGQPLRFFSINLRLN